MILKYLEKIQANRSIVLLVVLAPVFLGGILTNINLTLIPKSPYVNYNVIMEVPGKMAEEIERKVTAPAEKIFNGLPNLLSLESTTTHQNSKVKMIFKKGVDKDAIFLFIQEKMDRLKIILPGDVTKISVEEGREKTFPDIRIKRISQENVIETINALDEIKLKTKEITPDPQNKLFFKIELDIKKLVQHKVGLENVWKAMKVNSFTYSLGSKSDVVYFVDGEFDHIEKVKRIIVGSKGQKLIYLNDVAKVVPTKENLPKHYDIYIDKNSMSFFEAWSWTRNNFESNRYEFTFLKKFFSNIWEEILVGILILSFQLILGFLLFRNYMVPASFIIMDVLIVMHYLFWVSVFGGDINLLDFPALIITVTFCSFLWPILLARIRSFFYPSKLGSFIQRNLTQSILFTLTEYIPAILILFTFFITLLLPLILTNISVISQYVIWRVLLFGFPLGLFTLIFLSLFSPLAWIKDNGKNLGEESEDTSLTKDSRPAYGYGLLALSLITPFLLYFLPLGIWSVNNPDVKENISEYRRHESFLPVEKKFDKPVEEGQVLVTSKSFVQEVLEKWEITPNGLALLPELDLTSFKMALNDVLNLNNVSILKESNDFFKVNYSGLSLKDDLFSLIPLFSQKRETVSFLSHLAKREYETSPKQIFRSQLERKNISYHKDFSNGGRLNALFKTDEAEYSPFTRYFRDELGNFLRTSVFVLLFFFILAAIYLNSFVRAFSLTFLGFCLWGLSVSIKFISMSAFHLDSLWMSYLCFWLPVAGILLLSKVIDIERLRGNSRDEVILEVEIHFLPVLKGCITFFALTVFCLGLVDYFTDGLLLVFREGIWLGPLLYTLGILATDQLFRLYYLVSPKYIDRKVIFLTKLFYRFKHRKTKV